VRTRARRRPDSAAAGADAGAAARRGDPAGARDNRPASAPRPGSGLEYPALCLRQTATRGLGVFALRPFRQGETVERAPVIVVPEPQWEFLNRTSLEHYYYAWDTGMDAIVFGFGSFYNHADAPNVAHVRRHAEQVMEYIAARDIEPGDELTIRYGCPLWFNPA